MCALTSNEELSKSIQLACHQMEQLRPQVVNTGYLLFKFPYSKVGLSSIHMTMCIGTCTHTDFSASSFTFGSHLITDSSSCNMFILVLCWKSHFYREWMLACFGRLWIDHFGQHSVLLVGSQQFDEHLTLTCRSPITSFGRNQLVCPHRSRFYRFSIVGLNLNSSRDSIGTRSFKSFWLFLYQPFILCSSLSLSD